jgi:hypothetical protein
MYNDVYTSLILKRGDIASRAVPRQQHVQL